MAVAWHSFLEILECLNTLAPLVILKIGLVVYFTLETAIHETGSPYGMLYEDSH